MNEQLLKANECRKQEKFSEAVAHYTAYLADHPLSDEWSIWGYVTCLRKTGALTLALDFIRDVYKRGNHAPMVRFAYAQCVYQQVFQETKDPDVELQRKAVKGLVELMPPDANPYSPTPRALISLCKTLMTLPNIPWSEIASWINRLDPSLLSDHPFSYSHPSGKRVQLPSAREDWYVIQVKAASALGDFQRVMDFLNAAESQSLKWTNVNRFWMDRRMAFAVGELGDRKDAVRRFKLLLNKKREWYLLVDMARFTEPSDTLPLLLEAALLPSPPEMKVRLFEQLFDLLQQQDAPADRLADHLLLTARLRLDKGWPIPDRLAERASSIGIGLDANPLPQAKEVFARLVPFWKNLLLHHQQANHLTGVVTNLLPSGGGFIAANGVSYFFPRQAAYRGITVGDQVLFIPEQGFDKKKQRPSWMAIHLKKN